MPLIDTLNTFRNSVADASGFIHFAFQQDSNGNYVQPQNQREFITDSAYLKMFISWETFIESSFIQYMLGEPSILGTSITRYVQPIDKEHAKNLLIGTNRYVDWANPENIKRLCKLYFASGNHFETYINSISSDLSDLRTIRNAAAHLTSTTQKPLDGVGTRMLNRQCNNLKVSDILLALDPNSNVGDTILNTYLNKLDVCAEGIAKG